MATRLHRFLALMLAVSIFGREPARGQAADPGTALSFSGAAGQMAQIATSAPLNSYPLTVSWWMRTSDTAFQARGVVSKYVDSAFNGWSIFLSEGRLRGWYFSGVNGVTRNVYNGGPNGLGIDGGFVADGKWHHLVMTIDAAGGRFHVDGVQTGFLAWTGVPGAATLTAPLQIGRYSNYVPSLAGEIDEVSVWSVAKPASDLRRAPLAGNEAGLVAYWKADAGSGTVLADSSPNGRNAALSGGVTWVPSGVLFGSHVTVAIPGIGDSGTDNIVASDGANPDPSYDREGVRAGANLLLNRAHAGPAETIPFQAAFRLLDPAGQPVTLAGGGTELPVALPVTYAASAVPSAQFVNPTALLTPAPAVGPGALHRVEVIVRRGNPGAPGTYVEQGRRNNDGFQYWQFTNTAGGDAPDNVIGRVDSIDIPQRVVIGSNLRVEVAVTVRRYDNFSEASPTAKDVTFTIAPRIIDVTAGGTVVAVGSSPVTRTLSLPSFVENAPRLPFEASFASELILAAAAALPAGHDFRVEAVVSWTDGDGSVKSFTGQSGAGPLVALSGALYFGGIRTEFSELFSDPVAGGGGTTVLDPRFGVVANEPRGHTFNHASNPLVVTIDPITRDATVVGGSAPILGRPEPDVGERSGLRLRRGPILLDSGGATGEIALLFPAGFGVATPTNPGPDPALAMHGRALLGTDLPLGQSLTPLSDTFAVTAAALHAQAAEPGAGGTAEIWANHEKLPCWFKAPGQALQIDLAAGTIDLPAGLWQWVRADEMARLPGSHLAEHPSNDQFLAGAQDQAGSFSIRAENGVALLSTQVTLGPQENSGVPLDPGTPGRTRPHFPLGATYTHGGGSLSFFESALDPENSMLTGVAEVDQRYRTECAEETLRCPSTTDPFGGGHVTFAPEAGVLRVTDDLGLSADGSVGLGGILMRWGLIDGTLPLGSYAHAHGAGNFSSGAFRQAGLSLGSGEPSPTTDDRPGVLLLAGRGSPADPSLVERPGGEGYGEGLESDGQANYAGINLRATAMPEGAEGEAVVSGNAPITFGLTERSKYYVRMSGVSGIHERVTSATPLSLRLFGFQTRLDYFKLAFLSNENVDSVCDGGLEVPWPGGFRQEFLDLRFTCRGQPSVARLPQTGNHHELEYWGRADFDVLSLAFRAPEPLGCALPPQDQGFLQLGVRVFEIPLVATPERPLHGTLGFTSNGRLITPLDRESGVARGTGIDSRLDLPGSLKVVPPPTELLIPSGGYNFNPTTKAYFNTPPAGQSGGTDGFVSFAGRLSLPFFEEEKVHVHAIPSEGNSGVRFMGGWPASDKAGAGQGWADAFGRTYFTHPEQFDPLHQGHPGNLAAYRDPGETTQFRARARKNWLDIIEFDYPLLWEKDRQRFTSIAVPTADLLVIDIDQKLKFLNADGGEIVFGGEAGFPALTTQQLLLGAGDRLAGGLFSGVDRAIDEAIMGGISSGASAVGLVEAAKALDELIGDKLSSVADEPLEALLNQIVDPVVDGFYPAGQQATATMQQLREALCGSPANPNGLLATTNFVDRLLRESGGANLRTKVRASLDKAHGGATTVRDIVKRYPPQDRRQIVTKLVSVVAKGVFDVASIPPSVANKAREIIDDQSFIQEIENYPIFDEIERQATALAASLDQSRMALQGVGRFSQDLDTLAESPEAAALRTSITSAVASALDVQAAVGQQLAGHSPAALKARIKREIKDRFYASFVPEKLQFIFRARLGSHRGLFRELLDDVIAEMTHVARDAMGRAATELGQGIPYLGPAVEFAGFPGGSTQGLALRGYGRIVGNSMAEARVDGNFRLGLPDKSGLNFDGFLQIRDLHVTGPNPNCGVPGAVPGAKSEVTMGAKLGAKSKGGGFGDGMQIGLGAQFALDEAGNNLGFLGNVSLKPGPLGKFGKTSFNEATLELAWIPGLQGAPANRYMKAIVDGVVEDVGAKVRIFAGETCDINQLGILDKYTQGAMKGFVEMGYPGGIGRVAGVYFSADGQFPLEKIFGIPSAIINAIAKGGQSWLLLVPGGNVGGATELCLGYRQSFGVDVTALLVLKASIEMGAAGIVCVPLEFPGIPPDLTKLKASVSGRGEACVGVNLFITEAKVCGGIEVRGTLVGGELKITGASF